MVNFLLSDDVKVRNISGTCKCSPKGFKSWKKYWVNKTGRKWPTNCRIYGCGERAIGGAHVNVDGMPDEVYIIPMCESHNTPHLTQWLNVNSRTVAVCVERNDTSGPEGACFKPQLTTRALTNDDGVRNIQSRHACLPTGFRSWKKYWLSETEQDWPEKCRVHGCGDMTKGSGHVNVRGRPDTVYIIPMCEYHITLHHTEWFKVNTRTMAVCVEREDSDSDSDYGWT